MEHEVIKSFTGLVSGRAEEIKEFNAKVTADLLSAGYIKKLKPAKADKDATK